MDIQIKELKDDDSQISEVKDFLYGQIMQEYGIGPDIRFHYDIEAIREYYIFPSKNILLVAYADDKIVATAGVRAYDRDYEFFREIYFKEDTASIWRVMVDRQYRRCGIARSLIHAAEEFAKSKGYNKIYLHTHRYLEAALPFWESLGYEVTFEEDYDETSHMVKYI